MYDNPLHFAVPHSSPLPTEPLPTAALPADALPTESLPSAVGLPQIPVALDPELIALADPDLEVLLTAQPAFVQRAAVPFDVDALTGLDG